MKPIQTPRICAHSDCSRNAAVTGLCTKHYQRQRNKTLSRQTGKPCAVDRCTQPQKSRGYCSTHYHRFMRYGDPLFDPIEQRGTSTCIIPDCHELAQSRGFCPSHYANFHYRKTKGIVTTPGEYVAYHAEHPPHAGKPTTPGTCSADTCSRPAISRGLCSKHYQRQHPKPAPKKPVRQTICQVDGCPDSVYAKNYCGKHYRRVLKYNDPHRGDPAPAPVKRCAITQCQKPAAQHELCSAHVVNYHLWQSRHLVADPFEYMVARNQHQASTQLQPEKS